MDQDAALAHTNVMSFESALQRLIESFASVWQQSDIQDGAIDTLLGLTD